MSAVENNKSKPKKPVLRLEQVFQVVGVPEYTFVEPLEFDRLLVSLRTPGLAVIVEGPSGIGKTTSVMRALSKLAVDKSAHIFRCRNPADAASVSRLPQEKNEGVIIVDDFHVLAPETKQKIADYIKLLTDVPNPSTKLVILGINLAGDTLLDFTPDLAGRIEQLKMETNPIEKTTELLSKGENALNIAFSDKHSMAMESLGSFHLAQIVGRETCLRGGILETRARKNTVNFERDFVRNDILNSVSGTWKRCAYNFARGVRFKREGRAPYLQLLSWLAKAGTWSIDVKKEMNNHPEHKLSVGQIVDKGYVQQLLGDPAKALDKFVHYDPISKILSIEDPKAYYYLRHLNWNKFSQHCGFSAIDFDKTYDFALSFAGADRDIARRLANKLISHEFSVFYDEYEPEKLLGRNLEDVLQPIYASEAEFVIPIISNSYPERVFTKFESQQFKDRFGDEQVIPVVLTTSKPNFFDPTSSVGYLSLNPEQDLDAQLNSIYRKLVKRIESVRLSRQENAA